MTLNQPIPDGLELDNFKFLSWFWQVENGCIGGQPGPTDKDALHIGWNGTNFRAEWVVIKNCNPREMEIGPAVPFSFSNERKTVSVQVDLCDLVARAGDPLLWWAGTRRLPFAHSTFRPHRRIGEVISRCFLDRLQSTSSAANWVRASIPPLPTPLDSGSAPSVPREGNTLKGDIAEQVLGGYCPPNIGLL